MKILVLSDLHLEFRRNLVFMEEQFAWPDPAEYDIIVLAGDIGIGAEGVDWARHYLPETRDIIYVPGNHEYYGGRIMTKVNESLKADFGGNVHVLNPGILELDGITFIGATLRSPCKLAGYGFSADLIGRSISDFRFYYDDHVVFSPDHHIAQYHREHAYIDEQLDKITTRKVVVSHFLPSRQCIMERYVGDSLNPYFASDSDDLVSKADHWILGHTHERFQKKHSSGTPMTCNPLGYPGEHVYSYTPVIIDV